MNESSIPALLVEPLAAVQRVLDRFAQNGIVIGGIAASLLGEPRLTADIDAVIVLSIDDVAQLIKVASEEGISPRVPDAEAFARRSRVLLLQHETSGVEVDISMGVLPFEIEAAERGKVYQIGPLRVRLPTPEDFIVQKAVAHRPRDLADIKAVIARHPELDWQRIEYWVQQFADVLEMPELWQDIAKLRSRPNQTKPNRRHGD